MSIIANLRQQPRSLNIFGADISRQLGTAFNETDHHYVALGSGWLILTSGSDVLP